MAKEHLEPNHVAPTLFVGVGGRGSEIIQRIVKLAKEDDLSAVRFVVMDTDVNELEKVERTGKIKGIQTSSPRSVGDYLEDDESAKDDWFPVNNIINEKTVSEGAGQVRAISRLALNATIKNGNINVLYDAIDELFLKNGRSKNQAVKVVITTTTAGGTGSGIAMILSMMIRHYLKKFYPEASAIIRGYLILPGVMDTVIKNESERESLRRNSYATVREINAFMMKGSGFFESERMLKRYRDMHVTVPTSNGGHEKLDNLPFDFCFFLDRIDKNQKSMVTLDQYMAYAARTLYEQNIGDMRHSASSKEDNIVREFTNPKKLGRCRFGGAGASMIKYPYEEICSYIAWDWTQKLIFGDKDVSFDDTDREKLVNSTWLQYDAEYERKKREYEENGLGEEPKLPDVYMGTLEDGDDPFGTMLFNKYLRRKVCGGEESVDRHSMGELANAVVQSYIDEVIEGAKEKKVFLTLDPEEDRRKAQQNTKNFQNCYNAIRRLEEMAMDQKAIETLTATFARGMFESRLDLNDAGVEQYSLQAFLSHEKKALHPCAIRYLLYKLQAVFHTEDSTIDTKPFEDEIKAAKGNSGKEGGKNFDVKGDLKKQNTLEEMCVKCDNPSLVQELIGQGDNPTGRCAKYLEEYAGCVTGLINHIIEKTVYDVGRVYIDRLVEEYERFFNSFREKAAGVLKAKETIASSLEFHRGDSVWNLFNKKEQLAMLAKRIKMAVGGDNVEREMFSQLHGMIRENVDIRRYSDAFSNDIPHDVFEEVIVGYYRDLVEQTRSEELDLDILQAIRLEFLVQCDLDKLTAGEKDKELIVKAAKSDVSLKEYIDNTLAIGRNLASVGLCRKSFDEARDVNATAYSNSIKDSRGIRVADFFSDKEATPTVSRYEIRFFRSEYNVMPTEIFQFVAPTIDSDAPSIKLLNDANKKTSGESFRRYHHYMDNIGPDSRMNSNITPHVDKRWNSISMMPELDLTYQEHLMKYIHKALFYGFVFGLIERHCPSKYDPEKYVYRYIDGKNGYKKLVVSNGTKCDSLYEVLDALYFDRAAVRSIHAQVGQIRDIDERNSVDYEKTAFKTRVTKLTRDMIVGDCYTKEEAESAKSEKTSVFELVLLYYNSLPPRMRDAAEIETMVDAIIEAIQVEVSVFSSADDAAPLLGKLIARHYNLLYKNYEKMPQLLGRGLDIKSNDVMTSIKKKVEEKLIRLGCTMPELY